MISKEEILEAFKQSKTKSDVCRKLKFHINGSGYRKVNALIKEYSIDISHFDNGLSKKIKYQTIIKKCPVCGKSFKDKKAAPRVKTTCSYACANTFFRSDINNPNWKDDAYRSTCFHYHKKKCVVCVEKIIVEVHHFDGNHKNNSPENLIPLCPTHHKYWHSRHKKKIESIVIDYRNDFIENI